METKIRPLADRVLVRRVEVDTRTKGGILIPSIAQERPLEGIVLAVGRGRVLDNGILCDPLVKVGDRVMFGKYSGTDAKVGSEEHFIIREDEILAVVEEG